MSRIIHCSLTMAMVGHLDGGLVYHLASVTRGEYC